MKLTHVLAGIVAGASLGLLLFAGFDASDSTWPDAKDADTLRTLFIGFGATIGTILGVNIRYTNPPQT
jgi:hypothetical protein